MIGQIGVLCQDRNSFGFLRGLARRLNCEAELIEPTTGALAKSTYMTRRQAKLAALDLQRKSVDLIVRFTDADGAPWQQVKRHEEQVFPRSTTSLLVCGIAVENVEQWLARVPAYVGRALGIPDLGTLPFEQITGTIKNAIARQGPPASEVTARIVADAPPEVFRDWLRADDSLRTFYQECRAAAIRAGCDVPNELRTPN